jgi:MSHA biogenesis protein MshP
MRNSRLAQSCRGFALMMAVFMIVTLAAIAVYLLTMSTGQLEAVTQDEQATRAYQAARTGVDWGAYQVLVNTVSGFATTCAAGGAPNTQNLVLQQLLIGFRTEVTCQRVGSETEAGVPIVVYRLTVIGCNHTPAACGTSVDPTYVERQLQLTLAK